MIISERLAQAQREIAQFLYDKTGPSAVHKYANKVKANYTYCKPCEAETPTIETTTLNECMICGEISKIDE